MPIIGTSSSQNTKSFLQPNPPTNVNAADVGTGRAYNNGAATVAFTPAATGAAATSFTVTSSPGSFTATGASSPLTVTGLQSNTAYTFTAVASNAAGNSSASSASSSITATTVPQAPTIGTATAGAAGSGEISVSFTASATGGKAVSAYTATSSPGSITGAASSSAITVSSLTPGTNYSFTVTATNANGTSAASAASNSVTAAEIPKAAYAVAGYLTSGPTQNYDGMKLLQSNETISTFGYFDNNQQNYGHANSGVAGYTGGGIGFSSDARKTIITRVNFANDGTYVAANFPVARFNVSSIPNTGSFGYWLGGSNASTFNPDFYKMPYSNDSLSTLGNPGFAPNNAAAGLENKGVAGYTAGGKENTGKFGSDSSRIYKVNYSTDVITLLGITLTENSSEKSYGLNNSGTAGYVPGGGFNASKLTYSTETVSNVTSIWGASISFQAGAASGIRGAAGYLWRGSNAGTTHKFTYSSETGSTLSATYLASKTSMGGFANGGSY
jgi:hypothetical protein